MRSLGEFLRDAWRLAQPYFRSEERWSARGLLAAVVLMNLALVGLNVVLNYWNGAFMNALQEKDWEAFVQLLFLWRNDGGFMPGFVAIVTVYIVIAVYRTYLNQWLQIRWRRWMTARMTEEWLADRAYYRISLTADPAGAGTDNPDQRIAEDIRNFVTDTLSLGLDLISNFVTLFSFLGILWTLSGAITVMGVTIPGYMVWVAILYAALGTWLTHLVGRPLAMLRFRQERYEADFRFALVRLRENAEGVALYGGEAEEQARLGQRFASLMANWWGIMRRTKLLNSLVFGYNQAAVVFPTVVAAPRYFAGSLTLGGLTRVGDAFGQVQGALSWFVNSYANLASWRAEVERLAKFHAAVVAARQARGQGAAQVAASGPALTVRDLTLTLPDGRVLLDRAGLTFRRGEDTVITGRSGSGKSTLFRTLAGLWPFAEGRVERPPGTYLFLPQRPYIPLGTLRHAVAYPEPDARFTDAEVAQALGDAGLSALTPRLDEETAWAQQLSGGEQQRLAIARALLQKPDWLFLDEATASLDPEAEAEIYTVLRERLPETTIVSIAHRPQVAGFHDRRLVFGQGRLAPAETRAA